MMTDAGLVLLTNDTTMRGFAVRATVISPHPAVLDPREPLRSV